jgi:hypothetical protein
MIRSSLRDFRMVLADYPSTSVRGYVRPSRWDGAGGLGGQETGIRRVRASAAGLRTKRGWVKRTAVRLGLESTLRGVGRPRKAQAGGAGDERPL